MYKRLSKKDYKEIVNAPPKVKEGYVEVLCIRCGKGRLVHKTMSGVTKYCNRECYKLNTTQFKRFYMKH